MVDGSAPPDEKIVMKDVTRRAFISPSPGPGGGEAAKKSESVSESTTFLAFFLAGLSDSD